MMDERALEVLRRTRINRDLVETSWEEDDGRTLAVRYRAYLGVGDEYITFTDRFPLEERSHD